MKSQPNKLKDYSKSELKRIIANGYNGGKSATEIARTLGVSQSVISYHYPKRKHFKKLERQTSAKVTKPAEPQFTVCRKSYEIGFAAGRKSRGFFARLFGG